MSQSPPRLQGDYERIDRIDILYYFGNHQEVVLKIHKNFEKSCTYSIMNTHQLQRRLILNLRMVLNMKPTFS